MAHTAALASGSEHRRAGRALPHARRRDGRDTRAARGDEHMAEAEGIDEDRDVDTLPWAGTEAGSGALPRYASTPMPRRVAGATDAEAPPTVAAPEPDAVPDEPPARAPDSGEGGEGEREGMGDEEHEAGAEGALAAEGGERAPAGGLEALEPDQAQPLVLQDAAEEPLFAPPLALEAVPSTWTVTPPGPDELLPPAQVEPEAPEGEAPADPARRAMDAREARERDQQAAHAALQAWQGLAREVQAGQDAFVARTDGVAQALALAWDQGAGEILQSHQQDRDALDQATAQAELALEEAGAAALRDFNRASRRTRAAIRAAGRSAYGLINAGSARSASQIGGVVSGLVAGHVQAFNDTVREVQTARDVAVTGLETWRDQRAVHHPSDRGPSLERAKNEKRQLRIPRWVDPALERLQQRFDDKKQAWEQSRDNTSCSLECSYTGALAAENTRMAAQSRCQVGKALQNALDTLGTQTRAGREALREITRQQVLQLQHQSGAERSRLHSQARGALAAQHRETQGAVSGVAGAARSALPTYARQAIGFGQSLRQSAQRGAPSLRLAADRGATPLRDATAQQGARLHQRLQDNRQRHDDSVAALRAEHGANRLEVQAQWQTFLATQQTTAREQLAEGAAGFTDAFGRLAGTVREAASEWARPLPARMAAFIAAKRTEAAAALSQLRTGEAAPAPAAAGAPPAPAPAEDCPEAAAEAGTSTAECGHCGGAGGATGAGGGDAAAAPGLDRQRDDEIDHCKEHLPADGFFEEQLTQAGTDVEQALEGRANRVVAGFSGAFMGSVDEGAVLAALRGMTRNQGRALNMTVYPGRHRGRWLEDDLREQLDADSDDFRAASAYLNGDNAAGAAIELADSTGFFNDDEARIEAVMRSLSPDELAALGRDHAGTLGEVRDALDGTDQRVFDALADGDHALADAERLRTAVTEARREGDADATHRAIEQYTGAPPPGDWRAEQEMGADERRAAVVDALGGIVSDADVARGVEPGTDLATLSHEDRAVAFVTREVDVYVGGGPEGGGQTVTLDLAGANHDLAEALIRHGDDSVEVRAARLGVEIQRRGDPPDAVNIDRATFDPRFVGDLSTATPAQREAHRAAAAERARVLMLAAERYAGGEATPEDFVPASDVANPDAALEEGRVAAARERLIGSLEARFGANSTGAELAAGLLTDTRPSPETAAIAMEHAMDGAGTNEDLMFRFTERMDRDEIAAMREAYEDRTGRSLDADMGVYGEGEFFTELSGDDRLRMERAMLGQPRNDRERLEVAAFALEQQRREASGFGEWLAEGTLAEEAMDETAAELQLLAGGPFTVGPRGEIEGRLGNFGDDGSYRGPDVEHFRATAGVAQDIAQTYASRIDAFADIATTGIAILGAIAAAAITVVTGGAAAPLIAAAVVTGLASMSASYAIKGGRYGWEQAAVDLGMTAVQAITAGVGAQLGAAAQVAGKTASAASAASRTLTSLSRMFTGNPVVDQIIVGMVNGSVSGLGTAALDERTWAHGADDAVGWLFAGLARGALAGGATAAATNSIEALARNGAAIARQAQAIAERGGLLRRVAGGALGVVGRTADSANSALNAATGGGGLSSLGAAGRRGLTRGLVQAAGGVAGRGTELAVDRATGRFRGDMGDALLEMGHAGLHSFVQGIGEGSAEAIGQGVHNARLLGAAERINETRREMGLEPIPGDALAHGSPLRDAAEDLMFMQLHGRFGSDSLGRALSLEHIAQHGGMAATVVTRFPDAIVQDGMRAALLRHVDPALHGDFADVPIRVLSDAEFRAATRSALGDAVTLIENGQPVVVVREGASVARLADEGPHLVQSRDAATRARVERLDEATLARWDELDLDTQIDLYRDKVDLEIDAHEQIRASLERELADAVRAGDTERVARLASEIDFNDGTLASLRERAADVAGLGAGRRDAMRQGRERRPDYLDQPARLFSKRRRADDAVEARDQTVAELERQLPARADADGDDGDGTTTLPEQPPPTEAGSRRVFDRTPEEAEAGMARVQRGNDFNAEREHAYPHSEVRLERPEGWRGHPRADAVVVGREIVERKFSQLAELSEDAAIAYINQLAEIYHPGARIAEVDSTAAVRAEDAAGGGSGVLRGQMVLEVPEQHAPVPRRVLEHAERAGVVIRDPEGRIYSTAHPDGDDGVVRASARDPDAHAEAMRAALLRHVPEALHGEMAEVPIVVMRDADFRRFTGSERGEVVLIHRDGRPLVVVREGTPVGRLADEGPHLMQLRDPATAARVARLDEATLQRWDELDLDTQIELFRIKVELEIDAHERIDASLRARTPPDEAELARNAQTLHNLRQLQEQVSGLGPAERAAVRAGARERPDYLDQPARLFSKSARGVRRVFEPFVGPGLLSPAELAARYPGAEVIAGEASHPPDAAAVAAFEAQGGRFVPDRFGESLPDASVDRMHVRFPLPHDKAMEMGVPAQGRPLHEVLAEVTRRRAEVETVTNLAPHALRVLREGGEIEVVFDEASIHTELAAAQQLVWTDQHGVRWRLEPAGPATEAPRAVVAPHSGYGVPDRSMAHVVTLRKVRVPPTPEERALGARTRVARKREEREARAAAHAARTARREQAERDAAAHRIARLEREALIDQETTARLSDLREGRTTVDEDLRQRLLPVAASTRLSVDQLIDVIQRIDATLGISGRRIDAQEIIDSLRNRVRDGRPPRHGDLDGLVDELAVTLNALAIAQMREHLRATRPDAVLAVERGGALLAEALSRDTPDFPDTVTVAKSGPPGRERRTPLLEAEIRRRIETEGQSRFAIVDFYMGGVFAGELRAMVARIARDHPQVQVDVVWMRETHGFERTVTRPTLEDLAQGVALTGRVVWRDGRLVIENPSPMVTLPPLQGTDPALPQLRATEVPVDVVLGDDMPSVLDRASTAPIRVFDRQGRVVQVIPVGTPDPVTGQPLRRTRDIMVRLMQGCFTIGADDDGHQP